MKKFFTVFLMLGLFACTPQNNVSYTPISKNQFLEKPFGFDETIKNFSTSTKPAYKIQKTLRRNKHYPEKTDTIYKFYYKKSEIFFYKTHTGKEFLLAGKVLNKQIVLNNGVRVGISKSQFSGRFKENINVKPDSLQLAGEGTKYTFLFKDNKLYRINIDNYFD